jgi:hypothetical protein
MRDQYMNKPTRRLREQLSGFDYPSIRMISAISNVYLG